MPDCRLILGEALETLRGLPAASVDAVVTDPPAGISFMGKEWDRFGGRANGNAERDRAAAYDGVGKGAQPFGYSGSALAQPGQREAFVAFLRDILAECLRVAKPGAVALVWALPRTSHWTGTAIEDAGWVIEDRLAHLFGTGFPKHSSKLKPAVEDWWLCRKPGPKWLGVEAARIPTGDDMARTRNTALGRMNDDGWQPRRQESDGSPAGRWPANVCLSHAPGCRLVGTKRVKGISGGKTGRLGYHGADGSNPGTSAGGYGDSEGMEAVEAWECVAGCPVAELDRQGGNRPTRGPIRANPGGAGGWCGVGGTSTVGYGDSGGPSRFFFVAKASRKDRGAGNAHPTVKSFPLMRWLVRLACPPGGTVLDPFAGSGSTGKACVAEGMGFVGIERDPAYFAVAERRVTEARSAGPLFAAVP